MPVSIGIPKDRAAEAALAAMTVDGVSFQTLSDGTYRLSAKLGEYRRMSEDQQRLFSRFDHRFDVEEPKTKAKPRRKKIAPASSKRPARRPAPTKAKARAKKK
jgi:hypothetical protein